MPAIMISLKGSRSALLKFFVFLCRSGRAFASCLYSETHRLWELIRALSWAWSKLEPKEVDKHNESSLTLFSSHSPPSPAASADVGCNSSPSDLLQSTLVSKQQETEEESVFSGRTESVLKYEKASYNSAIGCENTDQEEFEPCSPVLVEEEDQVTELGGHVTSPVSHTPQRVQHGIRGTVPTYLRRYDRNIEIPENEDEFEIKTMLSASQFERKPRGEWSLCAHPEGALYHTAIFDDLRFSTDVNIYEEETFKELLDFTEHIRHRINVLGRAVDIRNAKNVEIVFDIDSDGTWEYYIADHKTRHLLWLEKYHIQTDIKGGAESFAHLKHKINLEYYIHLSYFPHRNSLPDNFFNELRGMITWTLSDSLTSLDSLAPYTDQHLERFLAVADRLEDLEKTVPVYAIASGARLWAMFESERYYNYSGAPGARVTCYQSVRKSTRKPPSTLVLLINLFFWQAPSERLEALDKLYVDHQVKNVVFESHAFKLAKGWTTDMISSTVLFGANIAYLAIPGILDSDGEVTIGSVASLISAIMSLCSIVLGLLLTKRITQYNGKGAAEAATFLCRWWDDSLGLFKLALMFSLPYGFFIWGTIAFVVAMIFLAIEQFSSSSAFIVLVATFCFALAACLWVVFQIDSWATFKDGLRIWRWLPQDTVADSERHFMAQKISRVRKRAIARAATFARESARITVRGVSTLFGGVTARPADERVQPPSV